MKSFRALACLFLFSVPCLSQNFFIGKNVYCTQMHLHGWSNHNGAPHPGSMQYHNFQADSAKVDVLWWTDHHGMFVQDSINLDLMGGVLNPVSLSVENIPVTILNHPDAFVCLSNNGVANVALSGDTINISFESGLTTSAVKTISYAYRAAGNLIKDVNYVKPMSARPLLSFNINPQFSDPAKAFIKIIFILSWHFRGEEKQDIITYKFIPSPAAYYTATNNIDSVWVQYPLNPGWQNVSLDLSEAVASLDHGNDNTISDFQLLFSSKENFSIAAAITGFKMIPQCSSADSIILRTKATAHDYGSLYNVQNFVGVEYSGLQHLNGYVPDSINNADIYTGDITGNINNWVSLVHANGGLVTLNHMYGTNWQLYSQAIQDYRADTIAQYLLNNNAFGADIIETGYIKRGGSDLNHHIKVWDKLTANGLFLYWNGVSDAHGSLWMNQNYSAHSYIWASDSSDVSLLQSLSLGKMFFANLKSFTGKFYYTLGNLEMGDRGFITQSNVSPNIIIDPLPSSCKVKITQGLLNNSLQVTYLMFDSLINLASPPIPDLSQPCFIRITVYDSLDQPLIFGQPIIVLGNLTATSYLEKEKAINLNLSPNPAIDYINVEFVNNVAGIYEITLRDLNGVIIKKIDNRYFYKGKFGYNTGLKNIASGIYFINIRGMRKDISKKFIIQKN